MKRDYRHWYSPRLHREMELLIFGETGAKVLAFPTREGQFWELEDLGVVGSLAAKINAGQLQLFCVEGLARQSLYNRGRSPADRLRRHAALEEYILQEVMPLMGSSNPDPCTIALGCSLGAYQAADLAFRHPHLFQKLVALSGRFDLTLKVEHFEDLFEGWYSEDLYFHTPTHFLPGLTDRRRMESLRQLEVVLAVGRDDPFIENNRQLSRILAEKGVRHQLQVWDGRAHNAGAWRRMAALYV